MRIFIIIFTLFFVAGCSNKLKQKIGLVTTGPNEYKVQKNKPLETPPHYDLPEPGSIKDQ